MTDYTITTSYLKIPDVFQAILFDDATKLRFYGYGVSREEAREDSISKANDYRERTTEKKLSDVLPKFEQQVMGDEDVVLPREGIVINDVMNELRASPYVYCKIRIVYEKDGKPVNIEADSSSIYNALQIVKAKLLGMKYV